MRAISFVYHSYGPPWMVPTKNKVTVWVDDDPRVMPPLPLGPSVIDVCWVDDNDGAGPKKLSNAIRCF